MLSKKKLIGLIFLSCIFSTNVFAGVTSGKVALIKNYNNGNTVFQLYETLNPSVTFKGPNCLTENLGRGNATVFEFGITGTHLKNFYSQLLMAQASNRQIKIEFVDTPTGYCNVTSIFTYFEL